MRSQVRHNFRTEKNIKRAAAGDKNRAVSVVSPIPFVVYHNQKKYCVVGKDQFREMCHDIGHDTCFMLKKSQKYINFTKKKTSAPTSKFMSHIVKYQPAVTEVHSATMQACIAARTVRERNRFCQCVFTTQT
jgi:hypothetical protein